MSATFVRRDLTQYTSEMRRRVGDLMQCKPAEWDYILKTIKRDCADMLCMGLIPLAFIPMLSLHKIHHVAQLKEMIQNGVEWSMSSEEGKEKTLACQTGLFLPH